MSWVHSAPLRPSLGVNRFNVTKRFRSPAALSGDAFYPVRGSGGGGVRADTQQKAEVYDPLNLGLYQPLWCEYKESQRGKPGGRSQNWLCN